MRTFIFKFDLVFLRHETGTNSDSATPQCSKARLLDKLATPLQGPRIKTGVFLRQFGDSEIIPSLPN